MDEQRYGFYSQGAVHLERISQQMETQIKAPGRTCECAGSCCGASQHRRQGAKIAIPANERDYNPDYANLYILPNF